jgi:ATP-dependent DNA helicase PIF1
MSFFDRCKKSHRFIMVALTGTAAALLNGSIYHSILGISDGEFISAGTLTQVRARLDGVDYIFLDEISMVSCCNLYRISAQAAKAHGVLDEPFGRITFIFSGDFAQLPPARTCIWVM